MIIGGTRFTVISKNSNVDYFGRTGYPDWTDLNTLCDFPNQLIGHGPEPHYHDSDEFWLFYTGYGEVWLDEVRYEITPNTAVYTPMGTVHRFHMFTDFDNVSVVTRLERQQRAAHLWADENVPLPAPKTSSMLRLPDGITPAYQYGGPPVPTVTGFVVPGVANSGPFADPGPRCPLSELRMLALSAGEVVGADRLSGNEHWVVVEGSIGLCVGDREFELAPGDVALLRSGALRRIRSADGARVALAREPTAES